MNMMNLFGKEKVEVIPELSKAERTVKYAEEAKTSVQKYMSVGCKRTKPEVLRYLRECVDKISNRIEANYEKGLHTSVSVHLSNENTAELISCTYQDLLLFSRYDLHMRLLFDLCECYGLKSFIKEKACNLYICVSDDEEYVTKQANIHMMKHMM